MGGRVARGRPGRPLLGGASRSPLVLAVALAAAVQGCARPGPPAATETAGGVDTYRQLCAPCHGVDGRGHGPVAAALATPPADLTTLARRHGGTFPRALVEDTLAGRRGVPAHGTREMPVWSDRFEPTDTGATAVAAAYARRRTEALLGYLESIQRTE
jgi:mono/diheme cytochrome c family protein